MLDFDYPRSNQPHIPAPSRLLILNMSMMDSDLKKQAEKAASISLAAPFLTRRTGGHGTDNKVTRQPAQQEACEAMARQGGGGSGSGCG
jgi:hypothetical protein